MGRQGGPSGRCGGSGGGGGGGGSAAEAQTEFTVVLKAGGANKIGAIKVVREVTGLGLKDAKDFVDGAPKDVKVGVNKTEADDIAKKLKEAGAEVEISKGARPRGRVVRGRARARGTCTGARGALVDVGYWPACVSARHLELELPASHCPI